MVIDQTSLLDFCAARVSQEVRDSGVDTVIRGSWYVEYALGLYDATFPVAREFILLQTEGFGSCHLEADTNKHCVDELVGVSALELGGLSTAHRIAGLDAAASALVKRYDSKITLCGSNFQKVERRAKILYDAVARLAESRLASKRALSVTMIGALGNVLGLLVRDGRFAVRAVDRHPKMAGRTFEFGLSVEDASSLNTAIAESDVILVTGMSLSVLGIDQIFKIAWENGTKIIMYMQTGAHLSDSIIDFGADVVISEEYPFYFMGPGDSIIRISSRKGELQWSF